MTIHYGFQHHLSPDFPSQIVVDVTERCNLSCIHCPHEEFTKSASYKGRHLPKDLNEKLVDEVADAGAGICQYLRYTAQGEPLLHPDFLEMVEYAGRHSGVMINVTTNGERLTADRALGLLNAGVDTFDISLDAIYPETYRQIRKKGDLYKTRKNVQELIEQKTSGGFRCSIIVSFIVQPLNKNEKDAFEEFWKNEGVDRIVFRTLHSCAGAKEALAKGMRKHADKRKPCLYPWERLVLSPTGCLAFCPAEWNYEAQVADFRSNTISEIWKGPFMNGLREAHLNNRFEEYPFCRQCPDWKLIHWPEEGKSYASVMQELKQEQS